MPDAPAPAPGPGVNEGPGAKLGSYQSLTIDDMLAAVQSEDPAAWDAAATSWTAIATNLGDTHTALQTAQHELGTYEGSAQPIFVQRVEDGLTSLAAAQSNATAMNASLKDVGPQLRQLQADVTKAAQNYHQAEQAAANATQRLADASAKQDTEGMVWARRDQRTADDVGEQWRLWAAAKMTALDDWVVDQVVTGAPTITTWNGVKSAGAPPALPGGSRPGGAGGAGPGRGTGTGDTGARPGDLGLGAGGGAPGGGAGTGTGGAAPLATPADLGLGTGGGAPGGGTGTGTGETAPLATPADPGLGAAGDQPSVGDLGLGSPAGSPAGTGGLGGAPVTGTADGLAGPPGSPSATGLDPTALGLGGYGAVPGVNGVGVPGTTGTGVPGLPGLPGRPGSITPSVHTARFPGGHPAHSVPGVSGVSHIGTGSGGPSVGDLGLGSGSGPGPGGVGLPSGPDQGIAHTGPPEVTDPAQTMPTQPPGGEPVLAQSNGTGPANALFAGTPQNGMGGMGMGGMGMGGMGMAGMGMNGMNNAAGANALGLPGAPPDGRPGEPDARSLSRGGVRDALQGRVGRVGQGTPFGVPPQSAPQVGPAPESAARTRPARPGQDADERLWKVDKQPVNLEPKQTGDAARTTRRRLAGG